MKEPKKRTIDYDLLDQTDNRHVGHTSTEKPLEEPKKETFVPKFNINHGSSDNVGKHEEVKPGRTMEYEDIAQDDDRHVRGVKK